MPNSAVFSEKSRGILHGLYLLACREKSMVMEDYSIRLLFVGLKDARFVVAEDYKRPAPYKVLRKERKNPPCGGWVGQ